MGFIEKYFILRSKLEGVTCSKRLLVKRLGRKNPSNCLVSRQEIVLLFMEISILFRQLYCAQAGKFEYWLVSSEICRFRTVNSALSHSGCRTDFFSKTVGALSIDGIYTLSSLSVTLK